MLWVTFQNNVLKDAGKKNLVLACNIFETRDVLLCNEAVTNGKHRILGKYVVALKSCRQKLCCPLKYLCIIISKATCTFNKHTILLVVIRCEIS